MLYQDPPMELGETMDGTDSDGNLINNTWLGCVFELPAQPLGNSQIRGQKKRHVGRTVKAILLRNESGITLLGKRLAKLDVSGGYDFLKNVTGYATDIGEDNVVVIDQYIATNGVADDDIFWGIIEGPTIIRTQASAVAGSNIAIGDKLQAGTGSSSQNSIAGGVAAHTDPNCAELVGTALSAKTTSQTNADILVNVRLLTL